MAVGAQQVFRAIITADAGGAIKEYKKYEGQVDKSTTAAAKQLGKTEKAMNRVKIAAGAMGIMVGAQLGKYAVGAARDLEEAINAVNVMYGDNAAAVLKLSETAAEGVGLSQRAFDEAAVSVGAFVTSIGEISGESTAGVLDDLITRASDFASVFNINVDEAMQRFRSGLAGETEPLRRFGINLLQSEVNAYAAANGIGELGEKLTENEKVTARYGLLMEKTANMAGDFANTSGDLANKTRVTKAEMENLAAEFGESLVPAMELALTLGQGFMDMLGALKVPQALKEISDLFAGLSTQDVAFNQFEFDGSAVDNLNELTEANQAFKDSLGMGASAKGLWDMVWKGGDAKQNALFDATFETLKGISEINPEGFAELVGSLELLMANAEAGNQAAIDYADSMGLLKFSGDELGIMLRALATEPPPEFGWTDVAMTGVDGASRSVAEHDTALMELNDQYDDVYMSAEEYKEITDAAAEADEEAAKAKIEHAEAVEDLRLKLIALVGGDIALRESQRQTNEAIDDYTESIKDAEEGTAAYQEIVDDAAESVLDGARAAADYAEDQAIANGEMFTAQDRAKIMVDELRKVADTLAPDSPLRAQLAGYVGDLVAIPRNVTTTITTNNVMTWSEDWEGTRYAGPRAHGGPVSAGRMYLVGEEGPELFTPPGNGQIIPNDKLQGDGVSNDRLLLPKNDSGSQRPAPVTASVDTDAITVAVERGMRNGYRAMKLNERAA